jgi:flagellar biosynthesis protein FliR
MIDSYGHYIVGFCYVFFRVLGLVIFLPFSSYLTNYSSKITVVIILSFALYSNSPEIINYFNNPNYTWHNISLLDLVLEFLIGAGLILPFLVFFEFLVVIGDLLDAQRGQTLALQYNPLAEGIETICSQLLRPLFILILMQAGLIEEVMKLLIDSSKELPIATSSFSDLANITKNSLFMFNQAGVFALKIVMPIMLALLIVDIAIIFINYIFPNLSLNTESFLAKSIILYLIFIQISEVNLWHTWLIKAFSNLTIL